MNQPAIQNPADARATNESVGLQARTDFFHAAIAAWLEHPNTTIACGRWCDGSVSELLPRGRARLLPARYNDCFIGVRELRIGDSPHHMHIDLGRLHHIRYVVAPSVCFGFRPSFEARLLLPGGCRALGWVRARASRGDRLGVGEAVWRVHTTSRQRRMAARISLALRVRSARGRMRRYKGSPDVQSGCALRLACAPLQTERGPNPKRDSLLGPGNTPIDRWTVSVMLTNPYAGDMLDRDEATRFFRLAQLHAQLRPDLVELEVEASVRNTPLGADILGVVQELINAADAGWNQALRILHPAAHATATARQNQYATEPPCLPLLQRALALSDASLVIYRDRTLVEFKTDRIGGVHRFVEQGHVSWQIGALDDHHCHLDLGAVTRVLFSAEPVSCQGGGLNYTIWFLTPGPSGNPYRRDGYFSIVLNRPYRGDKPRLEVVQPMLDLYRSFSDTAWLDADATFIQVLDDGPPDRTPTPRVQHAEA